MTGYLLTAFEVAELLGDPKTWMYEQSRAGRIPTVTLDVGRVLALRLAPMDVQTGTVETKT
ncbi:MAG: hypothetical protein M3459_01740 [Actinomycetota bacterium]|nr:hypothetical protein [Actinomycetota bacterium]